MVNVTENLNDVELWPIVNSGDNVQWKISFIQYFCPFFLSMEYLKYEFSLI